MFRPVNRQCPERLTNNVGVHFAQCNKRFTRNVITGNVESDNAKREETRNARCKYAQWRCGPVIL